MFEFAPPEDLEVVGHVAPGTPWFRSPTPTGQRHSPTPPPQNEQRVVLRGMVQIAAHGPPRRRSIPSGVGSKPSNSTRRRPSMDGDFAQPYENAASRLRDRAPTEAVGNSRTNSITWASGCTPEYKVVNLKTAKAARSGLAAVLVPGVEADVHQKTPRSQQQTVSQEPVITRSSASEVLPSEVKLRLSKGMLDERSQSVLNSLGQHFAHDKRTHWSRDGHVEKDAEKVAHPEETSNTYGAVSECKKAGQAVAGAGVKHPVPPAEPPPGNKGLHRRPTFKRTARPDHEAPPPPKPPTPVASKASLRPCAQRDSRSPSPMRLHTRSWRGREQHTRPEGKKDLQASVQTERRRRCSKQLRLALNFEYPEEDSRVQHVLQIESERDPKMGENHIVLC